MEATELVKHRHVFMKGGMCYIPVNLLISTIVSRFRANLSQALASAFRILPQISGDRRLSPMLAGLSKQDIGNEFGTTVKAGAVSPGDIDRLALRSMPMCMKTLQSGLKRDHKLRHEGRMQYGLFLKGIGLSLEDALLFFQMEFTKGSTTVEVFNKNYAYNIRHNYGKEGKRADYTPYSCQKIIMGAPPGNGEHHGCPFRHFNEHHVRGSLNQLRIKSNDIDEIIGHVKTQNYQVCVLSFRFREQLFIKLQI